MFSCLFHLLEASLFPPTSQALPPSTKPAMLLLSHSYDAISSSLSSDSLFPSNGPSYQAHWIIQDMSIPSFIWLLKYCVSYKSKICCNPGSSKSIGAIVPIAFAHFISLHHVSVILKIFQTLSLLYLLWWSVISDLWCYYCNSFGASWIMPYKMANLIDKAVAGFRRFERTDSNFEGSSTMGKRTSESTVCYKLFVKEVNRCCRLQWCLILSYWHIHPNL